MKIKENLNHLYKMIFKRKQYDREMRQGLLELFDELIGSNENSETVINYNIDDLLDKISKNGIKSLSDDEKIFLDVSSKI
jgi:hypothetical protein